jgi:hypothetical protein
MITMIMNSEESWTDEIDKMTVNFFESVARLKTELETSGLGKRAEIENFCGKIEQTFCLYLMTHRKGAVVVKTGEQDR